MVNKFGSYWILFDVYTIDLQITEWMACLMTEWSSRRLRFQCPDLPLRKYSHSELRLPLSQLHICRCAEIPT